MKPDQERVRSLLLDTVTLLCRNGLHFSKELKIEGLLGITLDDKDVFIVHLNETVTDRPNTRRDGEDINIISDCSTHSDDISYHRTDLAVKDLQSQKTGNSSFSKCLRVDHSRHSSSRRKNSLMNSFKNEKLENRNSQQDEQYGLELARTGGFTKKEDGTLDRADLCQPNSDQLPESDDMETENCQAESSVDIGLNLSVKDCQRKFSNIDSVTHNENDNEDKNIDAQSVARLQDVVKVKYENESLQTWFSHFLPICPDEHEDFTLNDNNNCQKGIWMDESSNCIPQKVAKVPLVTELMQSSRLRKLNFSTSHRISSNQLESPSSLHVPSTRVSGARQTMSESLSSYEQMLVESDAGAALNSSGVVRRPKCSRYKPFVCQVAGCFRMFFRGSELYRHQREKHGARHIRPRATSMTSV